MKKIYIILIGSFVVLFLIVAAILLMSGPRMRYQPSVQAFEMRMQMLPEEIQPFFHSSFDVSRLVLPEPNEENLDKGKTYYGYYCGFCHGVYGDGNGEVGKSYIPKPSDLSADSISRFGTEKLYYASFQGTGHSPVLERVVPYSHRAYILTYIRNGL